MNKKIIFVVLPILAAVGVLVGSYLLMPAGGTTAHAEHLERPLAQQSTGDLSVIKVAMPLFGVEPGGTITYTVFVRWSGSGEAPGLRLTDTLPAELTVISSNPPTTTQNGQQLIYDMGTFTMPAGFSQVQIVGQVDAAVAESTYITNTVAVSGDIQDEDLTNNASFVETLVQTPKPDLWVWKWGLLEDLDDFGWFGWKAEKGAEFNFNIWYFNWGGASASSVVLTDTLPPNTDFVSADPPPDLQLPGQLVWNLGDLTWFDFGEIMVKVRPTMTGTLTNIVDISTPDEEEDLQSNHSEFQFDVVSLLPPRITHPSPPIVGGSLIVGPQPRFEGLSRSGVTVVLYEGPEYLFTPAPITPVLTTTVGIDRVFSGTLGAPLSNGDHYFYARAISGTEKSEMPYWPLHLIVSDTLPVDPESLTIDVGGQTYNPGGLGGNAGGTPGEPVTINIEACCSPGGPVSATLMITNTRTGEALPALEPTAVNTDSGCTTYTFVFIPPSGGGSYDMQLRYWCDERWIIVPIVVILIDPAGWVYDRDQAGFGVIWPDKPDDKDLIVNATVTCTVRTGDDSWEVWNAGMYDQHNPQVTDYRTADGVTDPGYFAFFVPAGQYKVVATASGCAAYESPILTVVDEPIYHNVGMRCAESVSGVAYEVFLPMTLKDQ